MNKPSHNNKGLGVLAVPAVILILVIVGGAGAYVWHRDRKATPTSTATSSSMGNKKPAQQTNGQASTATQHTPTDALKLVQSTYTTALAYVKQTTRADQGEINAVESNLDTSLYSKLSAGVANTDRDQILCGQMRPDSLTTSRGSSSDGVVTIFVNEAFGTTTVKVTTTVNLSILEITNITCPQ